MSESPSIAEKIPLGGPCGGVYRIFLFIVLLICSYWIFLRLMYHDEVVDNDPLNKLVFKAPFLENCCSWWPISHFVLFFIIGLLYPNCGFVAMTGGILWELIEVIMSGLTRQPRQSIRHDSGAVEYSSNWWAGSFKDIFMNFAGFYSAKLITYVYRKVKTSSM